MIGKLLMGMISDVVAFVDASQDANRSRYPLHSFWSVFMDGIARIKVVLEGRSAVEPE
jgi:hypothetical protein